MDTGENRIEQAVAEFRESQRQDSKQTRELLSVHSNGYWDRDLIDTWLAGVNDAFDARDLEMLKVYRRSLKVDADKEPNIVLMLWCYVSAAIDCLRDAPGTQNLAPTSSETPENDPQYQWAFYDASTGLYFDLPGGPGERHPSRPFLISDGKWYSDWPNSKEQAKKAKKRGKVLVEKFNGQIESVVKA